MASILYAEGPNAIFSHLRTELFLDFQGQKNGNQDWDILGLEN